MKECDLADRVLEGKVKKGYVKATSMRTKADENSENGLQTEAAAMDSCFGLVRPHQHGTASR